MLHYIWDGLCIALGFLLFAPQLRLLHQPKVRPTRAADPADPSGLISIIVPARNEADNLKVLLPLLYEQTLVPLEIIVVDDGSEDGTAEVAERLGAKLIKAEPLPRGWLGKSWACWTGALAATGETLLFLDADTRPRPDFLKRMDDLLRQTGGLVTVQPFHYAPTIREQSSAFFNLVLLAASGAPSSLQLRRTDGFGPCAACSRHHYYASGGHERIKGEVLEHLQLGKQFKAAGLAAVSLTGRDLLGFRMYPKGWRALLQGWSKSISLGAGSAPLPMLLLTSLWLSGLVAAALRLFAAVSGDSAAAVLTGSALSATVPLAELLAPLALYALAVWTVARGLRHCGTFRWYTKLLYPLYLLFFIGLFSYSLLLSFTLRRVVWKGRQINVK
jgi:4,4'-diaponeurosporenoate glycosyltransferase